MYVWGLPLSCLSVVIGLTAAVLVMGWRDGPAVWLGVGVSALAFYAAVMCVHYFELSSQRGQPTSGGGNRS